MPEHLKYPKEYTEGEVGFIKDPFRPEFRYDSRGRLVMPLPGYSKFMLATEPGSKRIGQGSEDEAGKPGTEPNSLKTGYLHVETAIKLGPEGGWIMQLAGGDANYPISYFNETTEVMNFYVDKDGNVFLRGTIDAVEGGVIGGFTIKADYLESNTTPVACGLAPLDWPFWAGETYANRATAPFRVDNAGKVWASDVEVAGKIVAGAGSNIDWTYLQNISVLNAHIGESLTVGNTDADVTVDNPQLYAWITGAKPPVDADHTADIVSAMAYESLVELSKLGTTIVQGGYLKTILIDAQYIQAGIITGRKVRTSGAGTFRLVMFDSSDGVHPNALFFINAANNPIAGMSCDVSGNLGIGCDGNFILSPSGYLEVQANLIPSGARDLGLNGTRWRTLYLSSNIWVDGTVDGVDISAFATAYNNHTGNNNAHHNANSSGISIVPNGISTTGICYLGPTSTYDLEPRSNHNYDLGATSYYWQNLYLDYIRFNSTYGKIYHGAVELMDFYSYQVKFLQRIRLVNLGSDPGSTTTGQIFFHTGTYRARVRCNNPVSWRDLCYYDERNDASPIPTFESGIEQLKRIKSPIILKGEGLCFNITAFPKEFQSVKGGKKDKKHIDLKKVIGLLLKTNQELIGKVEKLENIIKT